MSEEQDEASKTEEPTQKRLQDARKKGQVAVSREVNHWAAILSGALLLALVAPSALTSIAGTLRTFVEVPHQLPTGETALPKLMTDVFGEMALVLLLPLLLLSVAGLASSLVQNGLIFSAEQMKPKLDKLSPIKGFKRIFGLKAFVEFAKSVAKLAIVGTVACAVVWPYLAGLPQYVGADMLALLEQTRWLILLLFAGVLAVMTVVAAADFAFQKQQHIKQMRMSKQEVKDEHKQSEGDPMVKSKLRQLRQEKSRKRMMAEVPNASVVVTNPTHYAVAMKYHQGEMGAPMVVAKGVDNVALRIRKAAEENAVPVVENPPLARTLYAAVDVDEEIPEEHYKAVAEVIAYVFSLRQKGGQRVSAG
mgnify:FL=1